jgi:hypothetical protein
VSHPCAFFAQGAIPQLPTSWDFDNSPSTNAHTVSTRGLRKRGNHASTSPCNISEDELRRLAFGRPYGRRFDSGFDFPPVNWRAIFGVGEFRKVAAATASTVRRKGSGPMNLGRWTAEGGCPHIHHMSHVCCRKGGQSEKSDWPFPFDATIFCSIDSEAGAIGHNARHTLPCWPRQWLSCCRENRCRGGSAGFACRWRR